jgi:phenylpropionate dioxygenase-like ring-hydroxylating dioxygenase large terminal subunit
MRSDLHGAGSASASSQAAVIESDIGLAPTCYTDPVLFEQELDQLFLNEWLCIGRVDEVAEPGDYFTVEMLGEPLLVVRSDDNQIRVLSNVCRHRSMQVAAGAGNQKLFVCPYHAWSYRNDGTLNKAPLMVAAQVLAASCRLPEFACEIWKGFYLCIAGSSSAKTKRCAAFK